MEINIEKYITPRLAAIASMAERGAALADIGTDHAYLPIYLTLCGKISSAVAADINEGPLARAEENIRLFGLQGKIKTVLSNGFLNIDPNSFDTAVIAGMGGLLISEIMKKAPRGKKYILQPMRSSPELKKFLFENGYKICGEDLAEEEKRLYNIIAVCDGDECYNPIDLYVGRHLMSNPLFPVYKQKLELKFRKKIYGMEKSQNPDTALILYYKELLGKLEQITISA